MKESAKNLRLKNSLKNTRAKLSRRDKKIAELEAKIESPNKMNGITTLILHLPIRLAFAGESVSSSYNVSERLCRNKVRDIIRWRKGPYGESCRKTN